MSCHELLLDVKKLHKTVAFSSLDGEVRVRSTLFLLALVVIFQINAKKKKSERTEIKLMHITGTTKFTVGQSCVFIFFTSPV